MIRWIDKRLAIAVHDRQLAEHGGTSSVRDDTLLESALARPQQMHAYGGSEVDIADFAACVAFGIARNNAFVDGNKRTAAVCCELFIALNGAALNASDAELVPRYLALAKGKIDDKSFAAWLRERITLPEPSGVQEAGAPR